MGRLHNFEIVYADHEPLYNLLSRMRQKVVQGSGRFIESPHPSPRRKVALTPNEVGFALSKQESPIPLRRNALGRRVLFHWKVVFPHA